MDSITELIKHEIKAQYGSVQRFAQASGIPYSTVSNAMARGVGSTSYDTVTKMCTVLKIRQAYDDDLVLFNQEFYDVYRKLTQLDDVGIHTVSTVLNVEYDRCVGDNDPKVKGYNGVGLARQEIGVDEEKLRELVRKAQAKKQHEQGQT